MAHTVDTEHLSQEAIDEANERLAKIPLAHTPNQAPPAAEPLTLTEPTERKQRTTVAKLALRYQEREAELTREVEQIEGVIANYQQMLSESKYKLGVWREALAEIGAD